MSLHWTLIAGCLYLEIAIMLLLLIPFISNKIWSKLFRSRFLKGIENQLGYYFYILVAILVLFFLDAIREMNKYSDAPSGAADHAAHLDAQMQAHMRLFRAQRNFYISGFALFLSLIIRKLVALITTSATLEVELEAAMKQAQSATRAAESLMQDDKGVSELEEKLKEKDGELQKALADVTSMKSQSVNLTTEYDRLMEEKDKLELRLRVLDSGADGDTKKDD